MKDTYQLTNDPKQEGPNDSVGQLINGSSVDQDSKISETTEENNELSWDYDFLALSGDAQEGELIEEIMNRKEEERCTKAAFDQTFESTNENDKSGSASIAQMNELLDKIDESIAISNKRLDIIQKENTKNTSLKQKILTQLYQIVRLYQTIKKKLSSFFGGKPRKENNEKKQNPISPPHLKNSESETRKKIQPVEKNRKIHRSMSI